MLEFRTITLDQLRAMVVAHAGLVNARRISAIHLHHTWRPRRGEFRGRATMEGMRRYHVERQGWSDIAQHLTIDPEGGLWLGRHWNQRPASATGHNGSADSGPFMIEVVGDFDSASADRFDLGGAGAQERAVYDTIAALLAGYGLGVNDLHPHCEFTRTKSCPGDQLIDNVRRTLLTGFTAQVSSRLAAMPPAAWTLLPTDPLWQWIDTHQRGIAEPGDHNVPETELMSEFLARAATRGGDDVTDVERWKPLRHHVVNLAAGELSSSGKYRTTPAILGEILERIEAHVAAQAGGGQSPRLLLWAHGGLVDEGTALDAAAEYHRWWLQLNVYPLYFVWESGFFEVFLQKLFGRREIAARGLDDVRDRTFEVFAQSLGGRNSWKLMKESAHSAFAADTGRGDVGGARLFLRGLAEVLDRHPKLEIHLVGHSAGSIFHSELVDYWSGVLRKPIHSCAFLAPAVRIDHFLSAFATRVPAPVQRLTVYTMDEEAELEDDLVPVLYGKSLLYLVSRACEGKRKTPLLGLQQLLRKDPATSDTASGGFFHPASGKGTIHYASRHSPSPHTTAFRHGDFDNDPATLLSVAATITGRSPGALPPPPLPPRGLRSVHDERRELLLRWATQAASASAPPPAAPAGGTRRALVVGINNYRRSPLAGCINDARDWSSALRRLGFDVRELAEASATREGLLSAFRELLRSGREGDELLFFFAGHGVQVPDWNGDESRRGRYDQAYAPIDFDTFGVVVDDEIDLLVRAHLRPGTWLTTITDCCHSGSLHRMAVSEDTPAGTRVRGLLLTEVELQRQRAIFDRQQADRSLAPAANDTVVGFVHVAACRDDQTAKEVGGGGVFTRAALRTLEARLGTGVAAADWIEEVRQDVELNAQDQTPGIDGDLQRALQPMLRR